LDPPATQSEVDRAKTAESLDRLARDLDTLAKRAETPTAPDSHGSQVSSESPPSQPEGLKERSRALSDPPQAAKGSSDTPAKQQTPPLNPDRAHAPSEPSKDSDQENQGADERPSGEATRQETQSLAESLRKAAEELRGKREAQVQPPPSSEPKRNQQPQDQE